MNIRRHHTRWCPASSVVLLVASGALALSACGNEARTSLELPADTMSDTQESGDTLNVDAVAVVDADGADDAGSDSIAEDAALEIADQELGLPDVITDSTVDTGEPLPVVCPEISIQCANGWTRDPIQSGTTLSVIGSGGMPDCMATATSTRLTPTELRWVTTYPELGLTESRRAGALRANILAHSASPGPLELRFAIDYPGLNCSSPPFVLNYEAPQGFYTELSWDDRDLPTSESQSSTDFDTHWVRDSSCAEDSFGDYYVRTRNLGLDWGVPGETKDNPQRLYDATSSPGLEHAWIESPSAGQIVHYLVHAYRLHPELEDAPGEFRYRVFIDGDLVADATAAAGLNEYIVLGAYADGQWSESAARPTAHDRVCPELVLPQD